MVEAAFLAGPGSARLPHVWLGLGALMPIVVALQMVLLRRMSVRNVWRAAIGLSALALPTSAVLAAHATPWLYVLYLVKDIYVVCVLELFWTLAHREVLHEASEHRVGLLCMAGALGGIVGGLALGPLAYVQASAASWATLILGSTSGSASAVLRHLTDNRALLATLVASGLLLVSALTGLPPRRKTAESSLKGREHTDSSQAVRAPSDSQSSVASTPTRLLPSINVRFTPTALLLIAFVVLTQTSLVLVDYLFNQAVERQSSESAVMARLFALTYIATDTLSLVLQLSARAIASRRGHLAGLTLGPTFGFLGLGFASSTIILLPAVLAIKVVIKALDYSWQRVVRESIYQQLPADLRAACKSIADVWAYRSAKAGTALFLLSLTTLSAFPIEIVALTGLALWAVCGVLLWRTSQGTRLKRNAVVDR